MLSAIDFCRIRIRATEYSMSHSMVVDGSVTSSASPTTWAFILVSIATAFGAIAAVITGQLPRNTMTVRKIIAHDDGNTLAAVITLPPVGFDRMAVLGGGTEYPSVCQDSRLSKFCGQLSDTTCLQYNEKHCLLHSYGLDSHCRPVLCDPM